MSQKFGVVYGQHARVPNVFIVKGWLLILEKHKATRSDGRWRVPHGLIAFARDIAVYEVLYLVPLNKAAIKLLSLQSGIVGTLILDYPKLQ
jgi:hypothetical protein